MKWMIYLQILIAHFPFVVCAQHHYDSTMSHTLKSNQSIRINFFISTKTKKIDPALKSSQLQAWLTTRFTKDRFYCLFVNSPEEMVNRISKILQQHHAKIGSIWFDSHGHFSRRRSLFEVGNTEFSYLTTKDTVTTKPLLDLAFYCDSLTKVGIGSCYAGATYTLPSIKIFLK